MSTSNEDYIRQLADCQSRLFGYLTTILGNVHDARDVLQETNLAMWRKAGEFEPGTNFDAWARRFAHFQGLAFLRDRSRDHHLFDEETLARLADEANAPDAFERTADEEREIALRECLADLPDRQREMIRDRYRDEMPIQLMADRFGKKQSAMKMELMRIREVLLCCIEGKIQEVYP